MMRKMICLCSLGLLVLGLASCGSGSVFENEEMTEVCETHTELQLSYLNSGDYKTVLDYAKGEEELSHPAPIELKWKAKGISAETYTVQVSESENLENAYVYETTDTSLDVYNLKVKTTYYWNVSYTSGDETISTKTTSFQTSDKNIRNIWVDGVTNFRDIGGYETLDGKTIKQGLIYRCGRLNVSSVETVENCITADGIKTLDWLGMKSEIDLRKTSDNEVGSITSCVAGDDIQYFSTPIVYTKPILSENQDSWIQIFDILGDEDNYPLMYHCNIGTDRTGVMTYLILGLLNVNLDDIYYDYCFSNFANIEQYRDYYGMTTSIGKIIDNTEGDTLKERIYNYLVNKLGVKKESLDNMISIMTE